MTTVEQRLQRIEDRQAIADLAVMYGYVMDEQLADSIPKLFTKDATLRSADGVFAAEGLETIASTYQGRFDVLGATNHFTHGHVVRFDDRDPDTAIGLLASHAEVVRNGVAMLVALRYRDVYRRTNAGWRFADRLMSYMYYVDAREYGEALASDKPVRVYGEPTAGDWPEQLRGQSTQWLESFLD